MSSCNTKAKAIMVVLVGLFGLLCVGFGVSVTEKYRLQKERVHGLERQLSAGRKEVLKVPELMGNLDKVEVAKKEVEDKLTACAAEKDGFAAKATELQKEVDTFGAIKIAVGVQISGLQNTIQEQQSKLNDLEGMRNKLAEQITAIETGNKGLSEKFELEIDDVKRSRDEVKNQLIYYTEAKKVADQELAEKQKAITELQKAKEALEAELAKIKQPDAPAAPETSSTSRPQFPLTESGSKTAEEIDKTFALLCERVTAPVIALDEVSILLSRMEKALKNLK
ncbi:MAG: hypothetical protein AYP45_09775 [Candidatus Brocadia carolinensis]|uniref:Uncharacterized protein n=1 Tax=Candidatus Brocadia carolinensis TaxID=1004156 RepID=A0A1V4AT96_9BACT|nr:MAG: hypothetical protein AYP45_09775 [Candidatus Brocadia caroliniensis]